MGKNGNELRLRSVNPLALLLLEQGDTLQRREYADQNHSGAVRFF